MRLTSVGSSVSPVVGGSGAMPTEALIGVLDAAGGTIANVLVGALPGVWLKLQFWETRI